MKEAERGEELLASFYTTMTIITDIHKILSLKFKKHERLK